MKTQTAAPEIRDWILSTFRDAPECGLNADWCLSARQVGERLFLLDEENGTTSLVRLPEHEDESEDPPAPVTVARWGVDPRGLSMTMGDEDWYVCGGTREENQAIANAFATCMVRQHPACKAIAAPFYDRDGAYIGHAVDCSRWPDGLAFGSWHDSLAVAFGATVHV